MSFTEAQLLADLATVYFAVDATPTVLQAADSKNVTWLQVNVLEIGLSEKDKKPIGYRKNVLYYVYNRGIGGEAAYYTYDQPINTSAKDVTISVSNYQNIAALHDSDVLQQRTLTAILMSCNSIFQETVTSTTSLTIGTGSQSLTVTTGTPAGSVQFYIGQQLIISNSTNTMTGNVTSYNSGTGALVVNVATTAGSGTFTSWTVVPTYHATRMKLVSLVNTNLTNVVMQFMAAIALNATVQSQGTAVTDSTIQTIITYSWDSYAGLTVA
jgi:hypothetical protein